MTDKSAIGPMLKDCVLWNLNFFGTTNFDLILYFVWLYQRRQISLFVLKVDIVTRGHAYLNARKYFFSQRAVASWISLTASDEHFISLGCF